MWRNLFVQSNRSDAVRPSQPQLLKIKPIEHHPLVFSIATKWSIRIHVVIVYNITGGEKDFMENTPIWNRMKRSWTRSEKFPDFGYYLVRPAFSLYSNVVYRLRLFYHNPQRFPSFPNNDTRHLCIRCKKHDCCSKHAQITLLSSQSGHLKTLQEEYENIERNPYAWHTVSTDQLI